MIRNPGAHFDQSFDQPVDGSALPPGGLIAKYCYEQQVIPERKTFHIQTKSGLIGLERFQPVSSVICFHPSQIVCTTDAHSTSEDHFCNFCWFGDKSRVWQVTMMQRRALAALSVSGILGFQASLTTQKGGRE
jgi:hypothetical protein